MSCPPVSNGCGGGVMGEGTETDPVGVGQVDNLATWTARIDGKRVVRCSSVPLCHGRD